MKRLTVPLLTALLCSGAAGQLQLTDVVEVAVADFIERASSDRPISDIADADIEAITSDRPTKSVVLELLQPLGLTEVLGTMQPLFACENESQILLIAGAGVILADGTECEFGRPIDNGDIVTSGQILNAGSIAVDMRITNDAEEVVIVSLQPGWIIADPCVKSCSVTCTTAANFACCVVNGACAYCVCRDEAPVGGCDSGGPASSACSITIGSGQPTDSDQP